MKRTHLGQVTLHPTCRPAYQALRECGCSPEHWVGQALGAGGEPHFVVTRRADNKSWGESGGC